MNNPVTMFFSEKYIGPDCFPMQLWKHIILLISSFLLVALGQPTWCGNCGLIAAVMGYSLVWRSLIGLPSYSARFWIALAWFTAVQLFQLSWLISHPYLYIYAIWVFFALLFGLEFALLSLFVRPINIYSIWKCTALAGLWALMEWARLHFMSGFTWNPVGLALSGNLLSMQSVALAGVYGLSFWVIFTNLLALRFWLKKKGGSLLLWIAAAFIPYVYGYAHLIYNQNIVDHHASKAETLSAVLVQTAFPIEEVLPFQNIHEALGYVQNEWIQILKLLKDQHGKKIDLIVFPECTVPYGTYTPLFPYPVVAYHVRQVLGEAAVKKLPLQTEPFVEEVLLNSGAVNMVSNAYWAQSISNIFDAAVLIGLEDHQVSSDGEKQSFISAQYFTPGGNEALRYAKRILLPMAEYIPSNFFKKLASHYGILGSFTPGEEAKIFQCGKIPFGVSICYEETFGDLMRDNKIKGAQLLVNMTSDIWYPHSSLPQSHFDHARLRAIELGIPLIRACNTGITGAVDSFGRTLAMLGETSEEQQELAEALYVKVPIAHYPTLYGLTGDRLIITLSFLLSFLFLCLKPWK